MVPLLRHPIAWLLRRQGAKAQFKSIPAVCPHNVAAQLVYIMVVSVLDLIALKGEEHGPSRLVIQKCAKHRAD
jgi:hypothetical protein